MSLITKEELNPLELQLAEALSALLTHVDRINPPTGPFWSGAPDQERAREALRAAGYEVAP